MNWRNSEWHKLWLAPEKLPLSEWAERNITLSSEYAARTGLLKLYGWQREPLDAFTDPRVETIVLMCSTQLLKTLLIQCALAYAIAETPGPTLVLQPKDGDAKAFSKERLGPMIRDCARLRGLISEPRARSGSNNLQEKTFPGGTLALAGAIAPGNLARRSIRFLFCDEVDKYPLSAGGEGDPIDLARERTVTFGSRRKIVLCCSPTKAGASRIGKAYDESDGRRPWVPCPKCGRFQVLSWGQVSWDPMPGYGCLHCPAVWNDVQRWAACERAQWRAERPFKGVAGFWISHLYSPWKRMAEMVADYLDRKNDRQRYQVFVNTTLAELFEEQGETPDYERLLARREGYAAGEDAVVPARGLFLTCAVDVQEEPPRLEYEVVAWGRNRENWSIDYGTVQAFADAEKKHALPVTAEQVWDELDRRVLQREYRHENGQAMPIMVMTIDTGKRPKPVYAFAVKHAQPAYTATGIHVLAPRTVVPIKGTDNAYQVIAGHSKEDAARKRQNIRIVSIGTHRCKQEIYDWLRDVKPSEEGSAVHGCYHFPLLYEKPYFEGLCSEKRVVKDSGAVSWEKRPNVRNEPLDLKVYNLGAATVFGMDRFDEKVWRRFEEAVAKAEDDAAPTPRQAEGPKAGKINPRWIPKRNWFE